jgi:hypothetical protein
VWGGLKIKSANIARHCLYTIAFELKRLDKEAPAFIKAGAS